MLQQIKNDIQQEANEKKAKDLQWFFKTAKDGYGAGDRFLGIVVPVSRKIAKKYGALPLHDVRVLLHSPFHEERLIALFILVYKAEKASEEELKELYDFYLANKAYVNNWDLVDSSAHYIVGRYLEHKNKDILSALAQSENLWDRRIAMIATYWFIKQHQFDTALDIAALLLRDKHDLIHKAVGWMLREVGNRSAETEEQFLKKHYNDMPRTMLRYAIEKFPEERRQQYLKGTI